MNEIARESDWIPHVYVLSSHAFKVQLCGIFLSIGDAITSFDSNIIDEYRESVYDYITMVDDRDV